MTIQRRSLLKQLSAGISLARFASIEPCRASATQRRSRRNPKDRPRAVLTFLGIAQTVQSARLVPGCKVRHLGSLDCAMRARAGRLVRTADVHPGRERLRLPRRRSTVIRRASGSWNSTILWKAENWQPEELMQLYVKAGAKYFVALANHHDNFDCYDSRYHAWNSVRVGPKKDIVGTWARTRPAARAALRRDKSFGARLALVPDGLRLRRRRDRRPECATTPTG